MDIVLEKSTGFERVTGNVENEPYGPHEFTSRGVLRHIMRWGMAIVVNSVNSAWCRILMLYCGVARLARLLNCVAVAYFCSSSLV